MSSSETRRHAVFSPSAAARWTACPASVVLSMYLDPEEEGVWAREGTLAHALVQARIDLGERFPIPGEAAEAEESVLEAIRAAGLSEDDLSDAADQCVDFARRAMGRYMMTGTEVPVPLDSVTGEEGAVGTIDFVSCSLDRNLLVIGDWKFGRAPVDPERNPQLMTYAAAVCDWLEATDGVRPMVVSLNIVQPRAGGWKSWTCTGQDLLEWRETVRAACDRARGCFDRPLEDGDFGPTDHGCRWCAVRGTCRARASGILGDAARLGLSPGGAVSAVGGVELTDEELAAAYGMAPAVEDWADDVRAAALERLQRGAVLPGYELGTGRAGDRKWASDAAGEAYLRKHLGDDIWHRKLLSPAQAEKKLKKTLTPEQLESMNEFVVREAGKPCVRAAKTSGAKGGKPGVLDFPNEAASSETR